jgi:hypothetical protein
MKKSLLVGLGVAATIALAPVTANANGYYHFHHFKHFHHYKPPVAKVASQPQTRIGGGKSTPVFATYMAASIGCSTLGLMLGSATSKLSRRNAHMIVLSCFLTPVGAEALMRVAYKKMPGEL